MSVPSGATIPGQSGPDLGAMAMKGYSAFSSITGASDCLVSYPGHSLGEFTPLNRCIRYILQLHPTWPEFNHEKFT